MSQFNPSRKTSVGTKTEQQVISDFLSKEPERPNERYSKNEMYQQIEKFYNTLCVLRKVWIESIGAVVEEKDTQKWELDYHVLTWGPNVDKTTLLCEINNFIEDNCGIANVINITHQGNTAILWYARSV